MTLIPIMFLGGFLFSSPAFSQDRSDQTQITRNDYISMDKQLSILEFRVKELEKNKDKIDTYRELIDQFKNSENEKILIPVAMAYVNLANKLTNTNQRSEAIHKFKNSDNQDIKLQLAQMEFLHNSLIKNS